MSSGVTLALVVQANRYTFDFRTKYEKIINTCPICPLQTLQSVSVAKLGL